MANRKLLFKENLQKCHLSFCPQPMWGTQQTCGRRLSGKMRPKCDFLVRVQSFCLYCSHRPKQNITMWDMTVAASSCGSSLAGKQKLTSLTLKAFTDTICLIWTNHLWWKLVNKGSQCLKLVKIDWLIDLWFKLEVLGCKIRTYGNCFLFISHKIL